MEYRENQTRIERAHAMSETVATHMIGSSLNAQSGEHYAARRAKEWHRYQESAEGPTPSIVLSNRPLDLSLAGRRDRPPHAGLVWTRFICRRRGDARRTPAPTWDLNDHRSSMTTGTRFSHPLAWVVTTRFRKYPRVAKGLHINS